MNAEAPVKPDLSAITDAELLEACNERLLIPDETKISEFSDEQVRYEYAGRFGDPDSSLEQIYEEFRTRGDAPECLRQYIYEQIGRILP